MTIRAPTRNRLPPHRETWKPLVAAGVYLLLAGCDGTRVGTGADANGPPDAARDVPQRAVEIRLKDWSLTLPGDFRQRVDEGAVVLWRPGFTIWANVWDNDPGESPPARMAALRQRASPEAFDWIEEPAALPPRFSYRLREAANDGRQPAYYGVAAGQRSHVLLAMYFDKSASAEQADAIWRSLREMAD